MARFSISTVGARRAMYALVVGVALVGTASLTAMAETGPHHGPGAMDGGPGALFGGPGGAHGIERLLDSVHATDAQRTQIRQIMQSAHADLKAQHEAGKSLHAQQLKLFTQTNIDANAVESLRQQMLTQHALVSQRMTQAMLDAARVLTPEQRVQLGQRMQARADLMQRQRSERQQLDTQQP